MTGLVSLKYDFLGPVCILVKALTTLKLEGDVGRSVAKFLFCLFVSHYCLDM
jgi:hypothetical protein